MAVFLLIVGLILLVGLIVVHEWGHFIVARRNGVEAEEFGIFFPPRLYKRKTKNGWLFTFNLLPLGGFVKLKGEHDTDTEPGSFGAASLWVKTKIMAAGVFMNLVAALVLLTIVALIGMPKLVNNQFTVKGDTQLMTRKVLITDVNQGSPAAQAGLQPDDEITAISLPGYSPVAVTSASNLSNITKNFAGKTVNIYYVRQGHNYTGTTKLLPASVVQPSQAAYNKALKNSKLDCVNLSQPKAYLGVAPIDYTVQSSTWSAPIVAVGFSAQVTALTFQGLGHALAGLGGTIAGAVTGNHVARENGQCSASSQVSGPVGIFYILRSGSSLGYQFMLLIVAIISLTLAIMNILPIPALDGGRLWITLIARSVKRPLSARTEEIVNATGMAVLIALIILITVVDVRRFF